MLFASTSQSHNPMHFNWHKTEYIHSTVCHDTLHYTVSGKAHASYFPNRCIQLHAQERCFLHLGFFFFRFVNIDCLYPRNAYSVAQKIEYDDALRPKQPGSTVILRREACTVIFIIFIFLCNTHLQYHKLLTTKGWRYGHKGAYHHHSKGSIKEGTMKRKGNEKKRAKRRAERSLTTRWQITLCNILFFVARCPPPP